MAKRSYFQKARHKLPTTSSPKRSRGPKTAVLVLTAEGHYRIADSGFVRHQVAVSKSRVKQHALKTAPQFTSVSAKAAITKRWAKHPVTRTGMRRGARLIRRKPVARQPLRDRYTLAPVRGVQYSPALKVWVLTDEFGTRPITERTALIRLGHLPKARESFVPVEIVKKVKP